MLNQSEESAGSSTAPRPELNPLLNPLLADNMKRWAEVFFSAAPDHRDEAVQALLEELRQEQSSAHNAERSASALSEPNHSDAAHPQPERIRCVQCGQENPPQYQFCGNCGSELATPVKGEEIEASHSHNSEWQRWEDPGYSEGGGEPRTSPSYASAGYHGLSILQGGSETEAESDVPNFGYEAAPKRRYRVYLGLFLALVIGGLGYKAWKATKGTENMYAPPPPPVSAADSNPAAAPEGASATEKTDADVAAKSAGSPKADGNAPTQKKVEDAGSEPPKVERASKVEDETAAQPIPSRAQASASTRPVAITVANGSEELSVAQQYLNGRNSAQAAPWLWKSVSKHNGQATLLLSDLYLKGDGVSKNCEQARILLDSAARKGVAGAGERLRHLAAFGCQ